MFVNVYCYEHNLDQTVLFLAICNSSIDNFCYILTVLIQRKVHQWLLLCCVTCHSLDPCLWGESDNPALGPPFSLSLHLASNSISPAGSVLKFRGDSVVRMWVQLKKWCVSCVWVLQMGHSADGCDLARLCVSMI